MKEFGITTSTLHSLVDMKLTNTLVDTLNEALRSNPELTPANCFASMSYQIANMIHEAFPDDEKAACGFHELVSDYIHEMTHSAYRPENADATYTPYKH